MSTNEFTYFGIGAALGVAAAVLLAPKSGPETRKFLRSKAEESTDYLATRASDARDTAWQAINRGNRCAGPRRSAGCFGGEAQHLKWRGAHQFYAERTANSEH